MTRKLLAIAIIALLALPLAAQKPAEVAFTNVNVLTMENDKVLTDQTVLVRGDQIIAVGPAAKVKVPAGATRIDGKGKYLLPGMAEMHGHIPPPQAPKEYTEAVLFLYVANGVTTVRGMLGAPGQLDLRERTSSGALVGPTLYLAGPSFNGNSVESPQQAERMVRQQKQEGWDLLKIHPGLTREEYDTMAKTAHEVGITFGGHVPADVGIVRALEARQISIDHVDGYAEHLKADEGPIDQKQLADLVRKSKEAGTWIVPTMVLWETLLGLADIDKLRSYPELRYAPPQQVENWEKAHRARQSNPEFNREAMERVADARRKILKALHDGGVPIIFGTDAPQQYSIPGFSIHREIPALLDAGLTPYQILHSATVNPGLYFKDKARFGTVTQGSRADLVLVDGNPLEKLENLQNPVGVMVRGRWLDRAEIQKRLDAIAEAFKPKA